MQQFSTMSYEDWRVGAATINACEWEPPPPSQTPSSLFVGHFTVRFSYAVDGDRYGGKFYSSHEWGTEAEVPILYNPHNPAESCVCDDENDECPIVPVLVQGVLSVLLE